MSKSPTAPAPNRTVAAQLGTAHAWRADSGTIARLPIQLARTNAVGWVVELGPFEFSGSDVELLRAAIAAYDEAGTEQTA
jgi:hypothetical protein